MDEPIALEEDAAAGGEEMPAGRTCGLVLPNLVHQLCDPDLGGLRSHHLKAGAVLLVNRPEFGLPDQTSHVDGAAYDLRCAAGRNRLRAADAGRGQRIPFGRIAVEAHGLTSRFGLRCQYLGSALGWYAGTIVQGGERVARDDAERGQEAGSFCRSRPGVGRVPRPLPRVGR